MTARRWLLFGITLALVPLAVAAVLALRGKVLSDTCITPGTAYTPTKEQAKAKGITLTPEKGQEKIALSFGDATGYKSRTIVLKASAPLPFPAKDLVINRQGDLPRDDGEDAFKQRYIGGTYSVDRAGTLITICLRAQRGDATPGRYQGSVSVGGTGVQPIAVPIILTFKDPSKAWPLICAVTGLLLGLFLRIISDVEKEIQAPSGGSPGSTSAEITPTALWAYVTRRRVVLIVSLLAGGILAAYVFIQLYSEDPVYGVEGAATHVKIFIAALAAQAGGMTTIDGLVSSVKAISG